MSCGPKVSYALASLEISRSILRKSLQSCGAETILREIPSSWSKHLHFPMLSPRPRPESPKPTQVFFWNRWTGTKPLDHELRGHQQQSVFCSESLENPWVMAQYKAFSLESNLIKLKALRDVLRALDTEDVDAPLQECS